jgi:hypothetical protein
MFLDRNSSNCCRWRLLNLTALAPKMFRISLRLKRQEFEAEQSLAVSEEIGERGTILLIKLIIN